MLAKCEPILNSIYGQDTRGTLMNDIRTLDNNINDMPDEGNINKHDDDETKLKPLDSNTYHALQNFTTNSAEGWTPCKDALLHAKYKIRGFQYKRSTAGKKESVIFFQPTDGDPLVPGIIREIFSSPQVNKDGIKTQGVLLSVQRFKPVVDTENVHNPFKRFPNFGAGLWHDTTTDVKIVKPSQKICHAIWRKWDEDFLVMRPLNRVSYLYMN